MDESVAVIVYTLDPEGNKRFLLRHNKPFDGYDDEWTLCFGGIEADEQPIDAAVREAQEEYGLEGPIIATDLKYSVDWQDEKTNTTKRAHFFVVKVQDISVKVVLNEESIGYDWMLIEDAVERMKYADESAPLRTI